MLRFVGQNSDGLPQKRSQALRACEQCRQRKKRCVHNSIERDLPPTAASPQTETISSTPISQLGSTGQSDVSSHLPNTQTEEDSEDRFIGDLNPESIFLAATTPQDALHPGEDNVGVWIPRKAFEGLQKTLNNSTPTSALNSNPLLSNILLPYMHRQCQQLIPSAEAYQFLHRIYLQEVHPILPVIDLDALQTNENLSNVVILKQAICLAASTSPRSKTYLQLPNYNGDSNDKTSQNFSNQLTFAMRASIDMGIVRDRFVIVQVLTVLAFFAQFLKQGDLAAEFTARAISRAQTAGLHLEPPTKRNNEAYLTRLFCCIWTVDKLNAAFQGRPTMLHEQDFGRNLKQAMAIQDAPFRLLLNIASLLDTIIALYRPGGSLSIPPTPSFEELIHECDASRVPSGLLATIELLYHAVTMLSCRTTSSPQGGCAPQIRESLSAASVVSIIGSEYEDQISYLPFAPYALSLSIRVMYRELRFNSKSPFTRTRARRQLLTACKLLRYSFADGFPSIVKVADLAEQTMKEMDKVQHNMLQQFTNTQPTSQAAGETSSSGGPSLNSSSVVGTEIQQLPDLNSTMNSQLHNVEGLPELDVFEFFDPDFDLDAIDAALADSMALAVSPAISSGLGGTILEGMW